MPTIEDMDAFVRLVETRSFNITAKLCMMTKSALSKRMKKLEKELGFRLIYGDNHHWNITDKGKTFYMTSKKIVDIYNSERIDKDHTLKMGCFVGEYNTLLLPSETDIYRKLLDVASVIPYDMVEPSLKNHVIDCFFSMKHPLKPDYKYSELFQIDLSLAGKKDEFPFEDVVSFEELKGKNIVTDEYLNEYFRNYHDVSFECFPIDYSTSDAVSILLKQNRLILLPSPFTDGRASDKFTIAAVTGIRLSYGLFYMKKKEEKVRRYFMELIK